MSDLSAFLNARLSEDEASANEVHLARTCDCIDRDGDFHMFPGEACGCEYPARVLREIAAKRRILAEHPHRDDGVYGRGCDTCHWDREFGFNMLDAGWCDTLRAVAAVYSDHPDYDPAWMCD